MTTNYVTLKVSYDKDKLEETFADLFEWIIEEGEFFLGENNFSKLNDDQILECLTHTDYDVVCRYPELFAPMLKEYLKGKGEIKRYTFEVKATVTVEEISEERARKVATNEIKWSQGNCLWIKGEPGDLLKVEPR